MPSSAACPVVHTQKINAQFIAALVACAASIVIYYNVGCTAPAAGSVSGGVGGVGSGSACAGGVGSGKDGIALQPLLHGGGGGHSGRDDEYDEEDEEDGEENGEEGFGEEEEEDGGGFGARRPNGYSPARGQAHC